MLEEWREIEGFERYKVSNQGRVFSTIRGGRVLKQIIDPNGYPYVSLMATGASMSTRFHIHVLVARAFIPNSLGLPTVNHANGIKLDCRDTNLEWATYADQQEHALSTGLNTAFGETHYKARLKWEDVDQIRHMAASGIYHRDIADHFGCGRKNITKIVNRQRWERRPCP
jgi:hypothetical protein